LTILFSAVQAIDVWKRYSSGWVLRGVSLDVRSIVVIYGANGSGKTTLVKILAGLVPPTRGEVKWSGRVGVALQQPMMHPDLTVEENLKFYAGALKADYREVVELFGLEKYLHVKFSHLSYGWRRRADLARALLGGPEALLLDEPMLGLDAEGKRAVAEVVRRFKGPAVVTASSMCDYVELGAEAWFELREGTLRPAAPTCGPT
jgi:heme exporter protein A